MTGRTLTAKEEEILKEMDLPRRSENIVRQVWEEGDPHTGETEKSLGYAFNVSFVVAGAILLCNAFWGTESTLKYNSLAVFISWIVIAGLVCISLLAIRPIMRKVREYDCFGFHYMSIFFQKKSQVGSLVFV